MALRVVLVGVVTGLGLDLPSVTDVWAWVRDVPSRGEARLTAQPDGRMPDDLRAFAALPVDRSVALEPEGVVEAPDPSPTVLPRAWDQVFEVVVEAMVRDFTAESSRDASSPLAATEPPALPEPMHVAFEPMDVAEDLDTDLAYVLNRASEGLTGTISDDSAPPVATTRVGGRDLKHDPAGDAPSRAEPESPTARLTAAVRLTREAALAWAVFFQGPSVVSVQP